MQDVELFAKTTGIGRFVISAPQSTFNFSYVRIAQEHRLELVSQNERIRVGTFATPFDALIAVAQHNTGLVQWDQCNEVVSDYTRDWEILFDDRLRVNVIDRYIEATDVASYRSLVEHVEMQYPYLMDRTELAECLEQLIITGQLSRFPVDYRTPAELSRVARLARQWKREQ